MIRAVAPVAIGGETNKRRCISTATARRGNNFRLVRACTPQSHVVAADMDLTAEGVGSGIQDTTCPVGHAEIALLIWAAVTVCAKDGSCPAVPNVEHIVERLAMVAPALVQAVARVGSMIPDHACWACEAAGTKANAMRKPRIGNFRFIISIQNRRIFATKLVMKIRL